jgi:hypothetical protein
MFVLILAMVFCLLYGMDGFRVLTLTSLEYKVLKIANTYD